MYGITIQKVEIIIKALQSTADLSSNLYLALALRQLR